MTKSKPKKPLKKSKKKSTLLPLLLTVFLFVLALLGVMMLSKRTELDSQAAKRSSFDSPQSEPVTLTHTYPLQRDYTWISVPGETKSTAADLCTQNPLIADIMRISNHETGDEERYSCNGNGVPNFQLEPHVGYIIVSVANQPGSVSVTYRPTNQEIGYTPEHDWIGLNNFAPGTKAAEVCAKFAEEGHPFNVINTMDGMQQERHYCEYPQYNWGEITTEHFKAYQIQ